jgi:DMSO/TMAO reductase YedYZ molybdopterin-dependent catalytic subunit
MTDHPIPTDSKLTASKRKWASEGKFITGRVSRPETDRLPPGQHLVQELAGARSRRTAGDFDRHMAPGGRRPRRDAARSRLDAFQAIEQSIYVSDIHCVTTWSRYDTPGRVFPTHDLLDLAMPKAAGDACDADQLRRYTTNLPLIDFAADDAVLATAWEGQPLTVEHGGPMRLIVPHLYFWKSAKWLRRIDFMPADAAGFWERNGYHMYADPWREQRYADD